MLAYTKPGIGRRVAVLPSAQSMYLKIFPLSSVLAQT